MRWGLKKTFRRGPQGHWWLGHCDCRCRHLGPRRTPGPCTLFHCGHCGETEDLL